MLLFYFRFIFQTRKQVKYSLFENILLLQINKTFKRSVEAKFTQNM